jgi:hypothetical protein
MPYRKPLRYDPAARMTLTVQGTDVSGWPESEIAKLAGNADLAWWIAELRAGETSARLLRKRLEALRDGVTPKACPGCGEPVTGRADAVYCGTTCRVRAHRAGSGIT